MNATAVGIILAATLLGANGVLIFDSPQVQMQQLNTQFNSIMNDTMGFFNHSWDIALKFRDPNYHYDPSELANYTASENPFAVNSGG